MLKVCIGLGLRLCMGLELSLDRVGFCIGLGLRLL